MQFDGLPGSNRAAFVQTTASPPRNTPPTSGQPQVQGPNVDTPVTVDGTPVRVAFLLLASGAGLWFLRISGFKFNVAVGN